MNESTCEPRRVMWAVAEISWEDPSGVARALPATIEDTSPSGACIRVKDPIAPGSKLKVKWHREQFSAIARNCRRDGYEYLLGVRREKEAGPSSESALKEPTAADKKQGAVEPVAIAGVKPDHRQQFGQVKSAPDSTDPVRSTKQDQEVAITQQSEGTVLLAQPIAVGMMQAQPDRLRKHEETSSSRERKVMESKNRFPKFWRREPNAAPAGDTSVGRGASVDKVQTHLPDAPIGVKGNLLSYDDIYRAAGILRLRSGYDINKVVEMLHCERLRSLSDEGKRASVLMAIEAAGSSADDLLRDANERQQALDAYEEAQKKQVQEFEARKAQEIAQIEAEMARVTAHYAERIKANLAQVDSEKEALRNWQVVKQHESQRIAEVMELCAKPSETPANAMAASAGAATSATAVTRSTSGPSLVS